MSNNTSQELCLLKKEQRKIKMKLSTGLKIENKLLILMYIQKIFRQQNIYLFPFGL